MKLTNKSPVFRITFVALNIALYFALSLISIKLPFQEITFKGLPVVLAALAGGPIEGVLVAGFGELICQATGPYGLSPTTPLWILPHIIRALIVALMMMKKDVEENKITWILSVILSGIAVTLVNSIVIWLDALIFSYPAALTALSIISRSATSVITSILYIFIVPVLIRPLKKLNKISKNEKDNSK